jgi:hypothetical protein
LAGGKDAAKEAQGGQRREAAPCEGETSKKLFVTSFQEPRVEIAAFNESITADKPTHLKPNVPGHIYASDTVEY